MMVWANCLHRGDLFVDVGANIGSYTIWAAELGADVVALEPSYDTFALLCENVALNKFNAELIQAAAGAEAGTAKFTAGLDSINRFDDRGSETVRVVTLDGILGSRIAAGVKVDVEGFELQVLRGAQCCLRDGRVGLLQLEWNDQAPIAGRKARTAVADLLYTHGYQLFRPDLFGNLAPAGRYPLTGSDVFARRYDTRG
jgi:FkbM family methyltransferase